MKRNLYTTALCGGLGLFGGLFIATGAYKDMSKSLSLLALATFPTAYITHLIVDTRAVRRVNEEKRLKDTAIKEASDLYRKNEKLGVETAKLNLCPDCSHHTQTFSDTTTKGTPRYICENCNKKAVISKFKKIN